MANIHNARKFKLASYNGIQPIKFFDMSPDRGNRLFPLLHNVKGLGFSFKNSYGKLGSGFFSNTLTDLTQAKIVGSMLFLPYNNISAYRACTDFIEEIIRAQSKNELYLGYYTPNTKNGIAGKWSWFQCELTKYEKTEYINNAADALDITVEFTALTPATRGTENGAFIKNVTFDSVGSNTTYDTNYDYIYSKAGAANIPLPSTEIAEVLSGFSFYYKAEIYPLENPVFTIKDVNTGETIGTVSYNGEVEVGSTFEFYSTPNKCGCFVDGVDMINNLDLSSMPFFDIPAYTPSTITVTASGTFGELTASVYPYIITM